MDGYGSHVTAQFDNICADNMVIPICMPPHSSHLLQPLDIGCFLVIKRAYGQAIQSKLRYGVNHINKLDFLTTYLWARGEAYKSATISNSFAAAGLVPFNAQRVIDKLDIKLRTPTPPGSSGSSSYTPHTPYKPTDIHRQASSIKALLRQRSYTPPSPAKQALEQLIKGCEIAMHNGVLLSHEIEQLRAENSRQKRKRALPNKKIANKSGMNSEDAQQRIQQEINSMEAEIVAEAGPSSAANSANQRAPPRCSNCWNIGHKRNKCPN